MPELYASVNFEWLKDLREKASEAMEIARQFEGKIAEIETLISANMNRAQGSNKF